MSVRTARRRPTISDVARLAGVSISTVSRVVNGTGPVAEETVLQVREAITTLNYTPSAAARSLAGRSTKTIGLLLPQISGAFFAPMLLGIEVAARQGGFDLLVHAHGPQPANGHLPIPMGGHNTDGILVFTSCLGDHEITQLHREGVPQLLMFRSPPAGLEMPAIFFENQESTRKLVSHLIEVHGSRRVAFLQGPPGNEESAEREAGYRAALQSHGIKVDPELVGVGNFTEADARTTVESWLRRGLSFDAVFGGDDDAATGAIMVLRAAGRRIPEDVAVVGFDDVPYARLIEPPLTTVRAPIQEAGLQAARQLISLIQTGRADRMTRLPTQVVIRRSCGCA
jgi:DNA-binding LacI/PurR family transcriptional regulator